jgi:hypothetical protein
MTPTNHLVPPPELLKQWEDDWFEEREHADVLLIQAFQAGADQELEACCRWTAIVGGADALRAARRPQPPTLKEQAMRVLVENGTNLDGRMELDSIDIDTIRRALEALPND